MVKITLKAPTAEELQSKIDKYMNEYPPAGYGTSVDDRYGDDSQYCADISRYSSCD